MVEFINKLTGCITLVADDRKDEYLAAGFKLAAKAAEKAPAKSRTKKEA